jgi:ribosome biogenesis GTPase
VLVVVAPEPAPDAVLVDRYLVMVEQAGLDAAIVANKVDLGDSGEAGLLAGFIDAGYPLYSCSARSGTGLDDLRDKTADRVTLLVGQSGVGKSSLLNALVPDLELQTGELSTATGEGRHTTTATTRYRLPGGGALVDSPGVREFWLPHMAGSDLAAGFREIRQHAGECRFRDCAHLKEPDCAVLAALAAGRISERRYNSYRQLARTIVS